MANADDAGDTPDFHLLPRVLLSLVENIGFPNFSQGAMDEDELAIYERAKMGRCMICNNVLGEDANFTVTKFGIVAGYCNGVCHTDMAVVGYLQEQHAELTQRIEFREGKTADEPETNG